MPPASETQAERRQAERWVIPKGRAVETLSQAAVGHPGEAGLATPPSSSHPQIQVASPQPGSPTLLWAAPGALTHVLPPSLMAPFPGVSHPRGPGQRPRRPSHLVCPSTTAPGTRRHPKGGKFPGEGLSPKGMEERGRRGRKK